MPFFPTRYLEPQSRPEEVGSVVPPVVQLKKLVLLSSSRSSTLSQTPDSTQKENSRPISLISFSRLPVYC